MELSEQWISDHLDTREDFNGIFLLEYKTNKSISFLYILGKKVSLADFTVLSPQRVFSLLHAAHRELLYVASVSIRSMTVELKPHRPRGESRPTSALASVWLFCVTSAVIFWFHVLHVTAAAPHNPVFLPSHLKSQENVSSEVKAYVWQPAMR